MAKKVSSNAIENLTQDWGNDTANGLPYSGQAVQDFIKAQFGTKVGYVNYRYSDSDTCYWLEGYATEADYQSYESAEDKTTDAVKALRLFNVQLPITTKQGVYYSARLYTDRTPSASIVSVEKKYEIGVRFHGIQNDNGEQVNAGIAGTLTLQRSADGGSTWTTVGTAQLGSHDAGDTTFDTVDIGQYFGTTNPQQIRMRVAYNVTDDDGNTTASAVSSWITFTNIVYTEIGLQYSGQFEQPIDAGTTTQFPLSFNLKGEVARTLHVKITGGTKEYTKEYAIAGTAYTNFLSEWTGVADDDTNAYGLLTHGVRTIEAWLTCSDGTTADAIESAHVTAQRMVVADATDTSVHLLLQNLLTKATNYVADTLCKYAVYTGGGTEAVPLVFRLSDYGDTTEYYRMEVQAVPGTQYTLPVTVEIEDATNDTIYAYFHAEGKDGTSYATATITVDNTEKFAPTLGASFILNPKTRNNSESNPETIINAATGGEVEGCTFTGFSHNKDLWEDNVLRVLAGQKVVINYDWLQAFKTNNAANVTMELDIKVNNITDESTPVIDASETYGNNWIGLRLCPLRGVLFTGDNTSEQSQDFSLQEGERTHIAINIVSALRATADSDATIAVCRVFINGVINREFMFKTTPTGGQKIWYNNGTVLTIGQEHADIDVYGLRIYSGSALSAANVLQDYTATLPTSEEKLLFRSENAILGGDSLVNADLCKAKGKNVLIWHGEQTSSQQTANQKGWWEIHIYNADGTEDLEHSGTLCKETGSLSEKSQGTTAKTYYYHNMQTNMKSVKDTITVAANKVHQDYIDDYLDGVAPTEAITVPDGWIDGNGMYRGPRYKIADDVPYGQKLVNKINYASAMQSHLMGACNLYNDLHTAIVGKNTMQQADGLARVAKRELPFLYFTQASDTATPVYQGPGTFGPGKMDDMSAGYNKKNHPMFCLMEGSDNNATLTDFRTPWQSGLITYDLESVDDGDDVTDDSGNVIGKVTAEVVGYKFNGTVSLDLDKFKSTTKEYNGTYVEAPSDAVEAKIKEFVNFIYLHSPMIRVFVGPWSGTDGFLSSDSAKETKYKWWCTSGTDAYKLRRWDEAQAAWVEAGWDTDTEQEQELNLQTTYADAASANAGQWEAMNSAFIVAIIEEARASIGNLINTESFKFHYCFVNQFLAGTDNCSKNTYYALDPSTLKWELWQDDMDTIFKTDNSGFQTKPYYIDRQHPYAEDSDGNATGSLLYEGSMNSLFNMEEALYESNGENREMFKKILAGMAALVSQSDELPWIESTQKQTPWGCLWKYFFKTQKYIPAVAYNEAARIRYEYPTTLGYVSTRNVNPITQSTGDQLQAELQYMKRRLVMWASYAEWGDFERDTTGNVGLDDATTVFGIQGYTDATGASAAIVFKGLVTNQYLYPGGYVGTTNRYLRTRCVPGKTYDFDLTGQSLVGGDVACAFFGVNYYRSLGDLGSLSVVSGRDFTLTGKRLTDVTIKHTETANFAPSAIVLNTPLVETIDLTGCADVGGALDLTQCIRLRSLTLTGCDGLQNVALPPSRLLTEAAFPKNLLSVSVTEQPALATLSVEGYTALETFVVTGNTLIDTFAHVTGIYEAQPANLKTVTIENIDWTGTGRLGSVDMLAYLAGLGATLKGKITMLSASADKPLTLAHKQAFVALWGDIDSEEGDLYVKYDVRTINTISISGETFMTEAGKDYEFAVVPSPATGNNIAVKDGKLDIAWTIADTAANYAEWTDANAGVLHVKALSAAALELRHVMTVTAGTMSGSTLTAERRVCFYRHTPQVGDFAYADGTFDSEWDENKTLVGLVFMRLPITDDSGTVTGYDVRIMAAEDLTLTSTGDTPQTWASHRWGLYPDTSNTNGFSTGTDEDSVEAAIKEATGLSAVFDIPEISNVTTWWGGKNDYDVGVHSNPYTVEDVVLADTPTGGYDTYKATWKAFYTAMGTLYAALQEKNADYTYSSANREEKEEIYTIAESGTIAKDDVEKLTQAWVRICGCYVNLTTGATDNGLSGSDEYAAFKTAFQAVADMMNGGESFTNSIQSGETAIVTGPKWLHLVNYCYVNDVTYLDANTESGFKEFPATCAAGDFAGRAKTAAVVAHAQTILNKYLDAAYPTTMQALADAMVALKAEHATDSNAWRWEEFYYPAAYGCYLYAPTAADLAEEYRSGRWYLPAQGELERIYAFYRLGTTADKAATGESEAATPILANANQRAGRSVIGMSNSWYWSVSEASSTSSWLVHFNSGLVNPWYDKYTTKYVRPCTAFTFTL